MSLREIFQLTKKKNLAEAKDAKKDELKPMLINTDQKPEKKEAPKPVAKPKEVVKKDEPKPKAHKKEEAEMSKGEFMGQHFDALSAKKHAKAKQILAMAAEQHGEKFAEKLEKHNKEYVNSEKM